MRRLLGLILVITLSSTAQAAVYDAPTSIAANCSTPVEAQLGAWLASVPDGSTARLAAGGCYGQNGSLQLVDRNSLTLDGSGAELRALTAGDSHRANLRLIRGSNLSVVNLTARGTNTDHRSFSGSGREWQHAFTSEGVYGATFSGVRGLETWGDGLTVLGRGGYCVPDATTDLTVVGSTFDYNGRNGVSLSDLDRGHIYGSTFAHSLGLANIDVEPDDPCWYVRDVLIGSPGNTFDRTRSSAITFYGPGQVSNVTMAADNVFYTSTPTKKCRPAWKCRGLSRGRH